MSDTLAQTIKLVFGSEGGYANHPRDPGGATKYGITAATLGAARRLGRKATPDEVKRLTLAEAAGILDRQYAQPLRYRELPAGLDYALFDYAVNSGPAQAVKTLQRLLAVEADGILGVKTLEAIRRHEVTDLIDELQDARLRFLRGLKTWPTFGKGWSARTTHVRETALLMANGVATAIPPPPIGLETATPADARVSSTVIGKGTIAATIGTASATIGAAKDALQPITGNGGVVDVIFALLVAGGSVAAIAGLAIIAYRQAKYREVAI
ncbi:glycoside hydrolase family 108 protein [Labrys sp. ZIDIC5]|uniref:glycoside hydrolase family 108 protein n=1 Tax=Labrys sedimenti TaxID=3106036 RepID=UPI002ACA1EC1|nr:glycosyl hydrolase 108 family protein [Labrys sp. ZIDIC5]MDZ5453243.1 glycosyl hydrolase 108 family protein [Labrys sp. ZIDIC5]